MKRVWLFVLLLILSLTFSVNSVRVSAQNPDVTILPEVVSVDSSLLVKVDPKTGEKPIRITWSVYNTGSIGLGSFPIVDGKGLCYFSNDDGNATCGPSPFFLTGETEFYVYVVTTSKVTNTTVPLNVSSMKISTADVNRVDNTVYMYFYGKKDWFKYSIYKEDLGVYQSDRALVYNITEGRYKGSITLNPGIYYFAFVANDSGGYGGALKRIEIPSGDFLMIQTNKNEYWTGEKIKITGTTNSDSVIGSVHYPDGTEAKELSIDVAGDQTFSYEFLSKSDWPEGEYEIKTSEPLVKSVKFSITEFFEVTPESVSESVNKSDSFSKSILLKNLRSNATNISFSTTGDMKNQYVTIDDTYLSPQETATISITITSVESDIEGGITIETPEGLELDIPVSITVVTGEEKLECPEAKILEIDKDYLVWSQECVAGEEIYNQILILNNGDSAISDFVYLVEDTFTGDQSLESLDSYGYVDIEVYDLSIPSGESEYLDMKITPANAGKYQGLITIRGGGDSAFVFVDLNCFEDVTSDLDSLGERLYELNPSEDVLEEISSDITYAQDAFSLGNYKLANEYYEKAKAKIETIELGGVQPQPMDLTWVIIVVVVIIVVLVVVWFFKFKKPQISEYEEETEELEGF